MQRANEWLSRHSSLHVVNVEVVEVSGVYGGGSGCDQSVKSVSQATLPAYLKILRYYSVVLHFVCIPKIIFLKY